MARLLFGAVFFGCVASAQEAVFAPIQDECMHLDDNYCGLLVSEDDEGDACCLSSDAEAFGGWFADSQESKEGTGPHFSREYHFFSRAGIVQVGVLAKYLASHAKSWTGGDSDYVLPVSLLAMAGNYLYVTMRMMENVAEQDQDTIDGISKANWIGLSRLYVYAFRTLELGKSYALAGGAAVGDAGLLYKTYAESVPYFGLWLAVHDLQGRINKVMALGEPQTEADRASYYKAWNAVYVYVAKLAATSVPLVLVSPEWKKRASHLSALAALGFLLSDLGDPRN